MVVNISKQGNVISFELDAKVLERLGIDESTRVEVRTNGRGIYLEPVGTSSSPDDLDAVMQQIEDRYESVFKKLKRRFGFTSVRSIALAATMGFVIADC